MAQHLDLHVHYVDVLISTFTSIFLVLIWMFSFICKPSVLVIQIPVKTSTFMNVM